MPFYKLYIFFESTARFSDVGQVALTFFYGEPRRVTWRIFKGLSSGSSNKRFRWRYNTARSALSPDDSAGPDSTASWVELSWVLKSDHIASGDMITAVLSWRSESQNLPQLDQLSWNESRVVIAAPDRTKLNQLSWVESGRALWSGL